MFKKININPNRFFYIPRQVTSEHAGPAAMLSALALIIGVVCGLQFSKIFGILIEF